MKAKVPDLLEKARVREDGHRYQTFPGEWYGRFVFRGPLGDHLVLVTSPGDPVMWPQFGLSGLPFDHVSVSVHRQERCPTWEEMCWVKDLCWNPEEVVIQYHPAKSAYVNYHPYTLHLWRPVGVEIPCPPPELVGPTATAGRA